MASGQSGRFDRRRFISAAAAAAAGLAASGAGAQARRRPGANERITIAGIGVGSQGGADVDALVNEGAQLVALCDVDSKYAAPKFAQYADARRFTDYREMLAAMGDRIDGVVIGTPDHTHAVIATEAMRRGKHVYCEKPLTHTVHEARALRSAARRHRVVTQLGNQGHSSNSIRQVCEWIWAGAIGNVHTVHAACGEFKEVYCQIGNLAKARERYEVPAELNYDLWLGPAQFVPYTPLWVHWNWRGWMHFGTGTVGDWVCHVLDPAFWALQLDAPQSVRAEVIGYDPAVHGLTYPPATTITYEFPARGKRGPVRVVWYDGNTPLPAPPGLPEDDAPPRTGAIIVGDQGMVVHGSHGGGGCHLQPEGVRARFTGSGTPPQSIERVRNHQWDWLEAIRTGREAGSNFDYGARLTEVALLGAIAIRFPGETLRWDGKAGRFTNKREANAFINPRYREGWRL